MENLKKMAKSICLTVALFLLLILSTAGVHAAGAVIDGKPNFKAGQEAGVYLWREANGAFRVRLTSGSRSQNAIGGFSTTKSFNWVANVGTESNDVIDRIRPGQVNFDLKTNANDFIDGIDFSVPEGTGVCFWSWGSVGKTVHLGANAVPVTAPVDVFGTGACGNDRPSIDGAPAHKPAQEAGVYLWRDANGAFRVRLTSGSRPQNAVGGFSTTKPFNWVANVGTESNDVIHRIRPGQVDFDLKTSASDLIDGVDFSVPEGAGVCFWSWGSVGKTVYLGAHAVPVTAPIDLFGTGACGDDAASRMKYSPGHYIALNDWDNQAAMIEAIKPGVVGIHKRYMWKDLEPSFGRYDFSQIESDLKLMADHGMQLVVMIEDKRFSDIIPTPDYLRANHTVRHSGGGFIAKRWTPWVVERMGALTQAMGERFDGHPNLEGIAFQESATSMTMASLNANGYTPERYRDALIQMLVNARKHFPRSQIFWYMNFIEGNNGYLAHVAEAVAPHRITMGGPDVLPDNASLNKHAYPLYERFKDQMTLFGSMQYVAYNHEHLNKSRPTKYWTMPELFVFARDRLHVNYIFWTRKIAPSPADSYDWTHALPVIRNNPQFNR